jgi:hypothetical protein
MIKNITLGSANIYRGDPTAGLTLLEGVQGEIAIEAEVSLVGVRPNSSRGAMVKGTTYAFMRPATISIPVTDESKAVLQELFASSVYDEVNDRLDFGYLPKKIVEQTICIVPQVSILEGTAAADAIWFPYVAPENPGEFLRFAAGGEEDVSPRELSLVSVYGDADQQGTLIPENSRFGWMGVVPSELTGSVTPWDVSFLA